MQEVYKKYTFDRFIFRQQYNYQRALTEIREGKKESCWMWYIFPQLRQLGTSRKSYVFGIIDADHANAYLKNPVLGPRLIECCNALLTHFDKSAEDILGEIDAQKLFSSMTLFASISEDNSIFHKVLCRFYGGEKDNKTLQILRRQNKEEHIMSFYGVWETWKIVYLPKQLDGGRRGVAFVEAGDRHHAMYTFQQEYAGQYSTIESCEKLFNK